MIKVISFTNMHILALELKKNFFLDATVYVGGLDEKVTEPLLWELFLQTGVVVSTHMPKVSF